MVVGTFLCGSDQMVFLCNFMNYFLSRVLGLLFLLRIGREFESTFQGGRGHP